MSHANLRNIIVVVAVAGASVGLTLTAQAASRSTATIHACLNTHTKQIEDVSTGHAAKCPAHSHAIAWNKHGATGATGARGRAGATGPQGPAIYHVAGLLNATTCEAANPSATTFAGSLVTTGTDAPYCKLTLTTTPPTPAIVSALVNGGLSAEFVEQQGADGIDLQTWTTGGVNTTGQAGAGFIEFTVTTGTG